MHVIGRIAIALSITLIGTTIYSFSKSPDPEILTPPQKAASACAYFVMQNLVNSDAVKVDYKNFTATQVYPKLWSSRIYLTAQNDLGMTVQFSFICTVKEEVGGYEILSAKRIEF